MDGQVWHDSANWIKRFLQIRINIKKGCKQAIARQLALETLRLRLPVQKPVKLSPESPRVQAKDRNFEAIRQKLEQNTRATVTWNRRLALARSLEGAVLRPLV